jgi:hypothetical protein
MQLNGNRLKLLAMVTMALDHIGAYLFPHILWLRIIGRLAFPIYAFLIAEGCRHTRSMGRYLGSVAIMGAICQIVYFFAMGSLYMCILVTFSLSIGLIWLLKFAAHRKQDLLSKCLVVLGIFTVYFLCEILPGLLPGTDFSIDYGFWGIMIPVLVSFARLHKFPRWAELLLLGMGLVLLGSVYDGVQHCALLSLPLILCYSGKRGKRKMKYFFYIFYPLHLALLQGIAMLVR